MQALRWAPLGLGLLIVGLLVHELRSNTLREALLAMAPHLSLLMALETGRFMAELISTRLLLHGREPHPVPAISVLRGQLLAHACNKVLPAGRAAGEAIKAALLKPHMGLGAAAGVALATQMMTLVVNGGLSLLGAACAAGLKGAAPYVLTLTGYGLVSVVLGILLALAMRSRPVMERLARFPFFARHRAEFEALLAHETPLAGWPLFFFAVAKSAQTLQLAILLVAVGAVVTPGTALFAEGLLVAGAAAGDLIPAQVGATEGAFTLAAPLLGVARAQGLSVALVLHGAQLLFAFACVALGQVLRPTVAPLPGD